MESRTEKPTAGATRTKLEELKGKIVEHSWWLKKQGFREPTIKVRATFLSILVRRGADLLDPESVKEVIAQQETWNETTKANVVCIYYTFLRMLGLTWEPLKYKVIEKLLFIPLETELDQLISGSNKRMTSFLQMPKETGVHSGEAWKLKWIDINCTTKIVCVNNPEKYSN
jgi:hypothetical protein